jgi:hypothetical protein
MDRCGGQGDLDVDISNVDEEILGLNKDAFDVDQFWSDFDTEVVV